MDRLKMLNCISLKLNKDMGFQLSPTKNPLKIILLEGHIFKTLAVIASAVVGGVGFECAKGAQARLGLALPASGGPRLRLILIEPFSSLTRFQEHLSLTSCFVVGILLSMEKVKRTQQMAGFCCSIVVFFKPPG